LEKFAKGSCFTECVKGQSLIGNQVYEHQDDHLPATS